ncbi:hypothetical protein KGQ20_11200 [Catenulispora sp. NF23]|uniref:hypothetical protein n=1 Tax=Catenulispora pinistramenti TaxID=2705254 RepID=UPI001BA97545|nr:hypothetical protein [Catenulispora pinistramenti]MBS2533341.1 hypothetical protein [Catenulispora pinistramenti]
MSDGLGLSWLADIAPVPVHFVHGTADAIVDVAHSRRLHTALRERGWPVTFTELDTDHAGIVKTVCDPHLNRCRPTDLDHAVRAGDHTAQLMAQAAGQRH